MKRKLLIVDDEPDILESLCDLFHAALDGVQCRTAASGTQALEILQKGGVDLILSDYKMPGMNGLDLLVHLRGREGLADVPAIFLSARVGPDDIEAGTSLGASYLTKPYVMSALLAAIEQAVTHVDVAAG